MAEKKLLYEVSIIRPLVIFLLVVLHSFTMYGGGWPLPEGIEPVPAYYWFCRIISGFRIEMIAMIAGYVFSYQSNDLDRHYSFVPFIVKKANRLLIPCWVFSILYFACFYAEISTHNIGTDMMHILSGTGHLWFLPMLFWCFLGLWVIDRWKLKSWWLFAGLALLSVIPMPSNLPFGFSRLPHFLFYCYLGYMLYTKKPTIVNHHFANLFSILFFFVIYIVLTIVSEWLPNVDSTSPLLERIICLSSIQSVKLLISCVGILAIYLLTLVVVSQPQYQLSSWIIDLSQVCYGVYVFQQFILNGLYYYSPLPSFLGTYWLPWGGCLITLAGSYMLTKGLLKTRTGRFLIG